MIFEGNTTNIGDIIGCGIKFGSETTTEEFPVLVYFHNGHQVGHSIKLNEQSGNQSFYPLVGLMHKSTAVRISPPLFKNIV
jgi:hypothetical protein